MSKRTAEEIGLGDEERGSIKKQKLEDDISHFDNLPIEALLTIFLWVPYEELAKCARVNKSWAHLLRQKELWKQKTIKKYGNSVTEKKTDALLACLTGIVHDRPRSDLDRANIFKTENGVIQDWRRYYLLRSLLSKVVSVIYDFVTDSGFKKPPIKLEDDLTEATIKTTVKLLAYPRFNITTESLELYLSYFSEFLKLYMDSRMPEKSLIQISKLIYDFVLFAWNLNGNETSTGTDPKVNDIFAKFVVDLTTLCYYANERNYSVSLLLSLFEICVVGRLVYPMDLAEQLMRAVLSLSAVNSSLENEWSAYDANVDNRGGAEPGQNIRTVIEPLFQDDKMNEIANVLLRIVHEFTSHSDYRMRACALSALKTLGVNPQWLDEALPRVVEEILPLVTDPSNAVRTIAVDLLYIGFDTVLDSSIQSLSKPQLQKIISILVSQIDVNSTTRMKCPLVLYTLLTKYSENRYDLLSEEDIELIGQKLLDLLKYQIEKSEHVNDVLNAVSDMAGFMHSSFTKFYEPFVRLSESLLSNNIAKKSNVITTMTLLGASVGKETFKKDVKKMLDDILGEQTMEIYQLDDYNKGYFLAHATPQIYECLLEEFDEYLPKIIPILLDTAERAIEVHQEAMNLDGDEWGNDVPMPENIQLTFERPNAEQADLKLDSLATLIFLIKKLHNKYAPFVERTITTFINIAGTRELPGDKNSVTMFSLLNTLSILCDVYSTTDVTSEKLRETYDQIIDTLQGTFSDNIIDFEYYSVALQTMKEIFSKMKGKFEFTLEHMVELLDWLMEVVDLVDFNHDDRAAGTDIANDQINTDREIDETLVSIIDLNKATFLEAFKTHPFREWIMDRTVHSGIADLSVHEQHNAAVFLDIIAEKYGDEVWEYVAPAVVSITGKITTPDPYLRQSIVFAIGTLVQHFTNKVEQSMPAFIEKLLEAYNLPNKAANDSLSATDNVISTLMKIWAVKPTSFDFKHIFGVVLEWGPLREDFDESKYVHPVLLNAIIANPHLVLDGDDRLRLYVLYILGLISKPLFVKDESMRQLIVSSWNLVKSTFGEDFNKVLSNMNDTQKNMLEKLIEKGEWPTAETKK